MVTICLRGRLGNQLFQVALGMHLEGLGHSVKYDLSATDNGSVEIRSFPPLVEYLATRVMPLTKILPAPFGRLGKIARLIRRFAGVRSFHANYFPHAKAIHFEDVNCLLDGFWQREEYSDELAEFVANSAWCSEILAATHDSHELVVHIRRGDYIKLGIALDLSFYTDSINEIVFKNPFIESVVVITDDQSYCAANLRLNVPFRIFDGGSPLNDFGYLVGANHLLISRSTFSWWAARFGNGTVFYPAPWSSADKQSDSEIIPINWSPIHERKSL